MRTTTFKTEPTTVDVTEYIQAHGRRPRRDQYGAWLFTVDRATVALTGEYRYCTQRLATEFAGGAYVLQP